MFFDAAIGLLILESTFINRQKGLIKASPEYFADCFAETNLLPQ
jgi:hypothetical protein